MRHNLRVRTVFGIFLLLLSSSSFSQKLVGTLRTGGRHGVGMVYAVSGNEKVTVPFYDEVAYPVGDFTQYKDKVVGLSAQDILGDRFASSRLVLFSSLGPEAQPRQEHSNLSFSAPSMSLKGYLPKHDLFSIDGDFIVSTGGSNVVVISNLDKGGVPDTFRTDTINLISRGRPIIKGDKVFYGGVTGKADTFYFFSFDRNTRQKQLLFKKSAEKLGYVSGGYFFQGDSLYFIGQPVNNGAQTLWRIDLANNKLDSVRGFYYDGGTDGFGRFASSGNWYYNTTSSGGSEGSGVFYRYNSKSLSFEILKKFSETDGFPIGEVVQVKGMIYGLLLSSSPTKKVSLFRYDPQLNSFTIIKEVDNTNGHMASGLLCFNDELYLYGAKAGQNKHGSVIKLNSEGDELLKYDSFAFRHVSFKDNNPLIFGGQVYGLTDSALYKVDFGSETILRAYEFLGSEKIRSANSFHATVVGSKVYGISRNDTNGVFMFSYDFLTKQFNKGLFLGQSLAFSPSMVNKGGKLYFTSYKNQNLCMVEFDPISNDTNMYELPVNNCFSAEGLVLVGDTIYAGLFGPGCLPGVDMLMLKFNTLNHSSDTIALKDLNGGYAYGDLCAIGDKLYFYLDKNEVSNYFEYDLFTGAVSKKTSLSDSLSTISRMPTSGDLIYTVDATPQREVFFCTRNVVTGERARIPLEFFNEIQFTFTAVGDFSITGIETNRSDKRVLSLFPNPVSTTLNLLGMQNEIQSIKIFDLTGRELPIGEFSENSLNVSSYPPGIYVVSVTTNEGVISSKFIKQ